VRALTVKRLTVFPLALKMRRKVTHAASQRAVSEPIVVAIELMNGITGYGETLPRAYVTGETNATVIELLRGDFTKQLLAFRAQTLPEAWEQVEALPLLDESGHRCSAARAAVELALIDGLLRTTGRDLGDLAGWLGMPSFGAPGSLRQVRYGMVLASESLRSLRRTVRLARLARMRDFKLKVGIRGRRRTGAAGGGDVAAGFAFGPDDLAAGCQCRLGFTDGGRGFESLAGCPHRGGGAAPFRRRG
jgi:L-alanine-DL-glutamate epimerase-like enolase superfamily enzyme